MRNQRIELRRVVAVAVLAAVLGGWTGVPLGAAGGDSGSRVEVGRDGGPGLSAALPQWVARWLQSLGVPGFRSLSAPGGIGMDPNGAPEAAEPPVDSEGGIGLDPNG